MNSTIFNRSRMDSGSSPILEKCLLINKTRMDIQNSMKWGAINALLLAIFIYDVSYTCPLYLQFYNYVEYVLIAIFLFNVIYYIFKLIKLSVTNREQVVINQEQKRLLGIRDSDPNYRVLKGNELQQSPSRNVFGSSVVGSPAGNASSLNTTGVSWRSNVSQNDSLNYSLSASWSYHKGSPDVQQQSSFLFNRTTPVKSAFQDSRSVELIRDEEELQQFLKDHEKSESVNKLANKSRQSSNLLSSFWSHPVTKTAKDMSSLLKRCQYQLSTQSPTKSNSNSPSGKAEDLTTSVANQEVWTRINVDVVALTQWNENLRLWISKTILERLVNEFDSINRSLDEHGFGDIKIGSVGLDRLRKTAQMAPVFQFSPSLINLIPFLEVHPNQEYLVKRIRELAKGGCISEFKWNGGSSYNGKEWDDSLPSDCAIIMHLLASYLDTQLLPAPNKPDTKPFSGHHYIKFSDKMPELTPKSLFIHQASEKPPHYRVVVGEKVYEMIKGYNNLFHSILFFIYHVNKVEHGMLGRVNLGRAGVNILWIIDQ